MSIAYGEFVGPSLTHARFQTRSSYDRSTARSLHGHTRPARTALICRDQLATESHGQLEATPIQPIRQATRDATRAASEAPG